VLILAAAGILIGLDAGSLALTRLMATVLYQTSATNPAAFTAGAVLLTAAALLSELFAGAERHAD
jgi:hypothetical protein